MAATKVDFDVAVAFAPQTVEGTYEGDLDAISGTLNGQGGVGGADDGLLLGDANSGVNGSGVDFTMGRRSSENPKVTASLTTPVSNFEAAEVQTFNFAFPFCGNRDDATSTIVDADCTPLVGVDALLQSVGMSGAAVAGGPIGWLYQFATPAPFPMSALLYYFGNRIELMDCRSSSLQITYTPGAVPIAAANISVGSVKDPTSNTITEVALPTPNYGDQNTVSAPICENAAFTWLGSAIGFDQLVVNITPSVEQVRDSNAPDGFVLDISAREVTLEGTIYTDTETAHDQVMALEQIFATGSGDLSPLSFRTGVVGTDSNPVKGHRWVIDQPEVTDIGVSIIGSKAACKVSLRARHGTANNEVDLYFD